MPTTKKKPAAPRVVSRPGDNNGTTGEVFVLAEAAAYLRVSEPAVVDLVRSQSLPARLIDGEWRFLKSAIQNWLSAGSSDPQARKEAQLALSGKYKDDPDLMQICAEAYKQRGSTVTEDE